MAKIIISTPFMFALFAGFLLLSLSAVSSMSNENNIIKEVIAEKEVTELVRGMVASALKDVDIIMKPKETSKAIQFSCVGFDASCGPLYPCCNGITCCFDAWQFRFKCC